MTPDQFAALSQMMRQRPGSKSRRTAELMLLRGMTASEAAREVGITPQTAATTLKACRKMLALAAQALGVEAPPEAAKRDKKSKSQPAKEA